MQESGAGTVDWAFPHRFWTETKFTQKRRIETHDKFRKKKPVVFICYADDTEQTGSMLFNMFLAKGFDPTTASDMDFMPDKDQIEKINLKLLPEYEFFLAILSKGLSLPSASNQRNIRFVRAAIDANRTGGRPIIFTLRTSAYAPMNELEHISPTPLLTNTDLQLFLSNLKQQAIQMGFSSSNMTPGFA